MKKILMGLILILAAKSAFAGDETATMHVGYFANLTHLTAILGRANGAFEKSLGPGTHIEWTIFNAGPSVIEALFAGKIDLAYIGPSPAVNGFVKSRGEALRVVAGAASGGAALVVREDAGIQSPADFRAKKIASPQIGNTQDVALRAWIAGQGLALKEKGGDVQVLPVASADQVTLFARKEIDAAWNVEPWVSILAQNGGRIFLDEASLWPEGKYATTLVVARKEFLDRHPDAVKKFLAAHLEVTQWIHDDPAAAKRLFNAELEKWTRKRLPDAVLDSAFQRIRFTWEPLKASVERQAEAATKAGFLKVRPDVSALFDLKLLETLQSDKIQGSNQS